MSRWTMPQVTLEKEAEVVAAMAAEKDLQIAEQRETISILEVKIQKLEQLVRLKDSKIATLTAKLQKQQPWSVYHMTLRWLPSRSQVQVHQETNWMDVLVKCPA